MRILIRKAAYGGLFGGLFFAAITGLISPSRGNDWVWVWGLAFAALCGIVGILTDEEQSWSDTCESMSDRDGYRPARLVRPERQDQLGISYPTDPRHNRSEPQGFNDIWSAPRDNNKQFATATDNGGRAWTGLTQGLQNHWWIVLGSLLAIGFAVGMLRAVSSHEPTLPFATAVILGLAGLLVFLVGTGKLESFVTGTINNHKALAWFMISFVALVLSVMWARQEGIPVLRDEMVLLAGLSTALAVLQLVGLLQPILSGIVGWFGKVYNGEYGRFWQVFAAGVSLLALSAGLFLLRELDMVQSWGDAEENLGLAAWGMCALGWFLVIFSARGLKKD